MLAEPLAAPAQKAEKVYRIGYLSSASPSPPSGLEPFRKRLRELGYVEGRNITIEARWADGDAARLPRLAHALVELIA
jgi:putative ABC transport system substrate-binding protein